MNRIPSTAVALIAGGRSSRMGVDKARLVDRDGRELWRGRWELLLETAARLPGWSGEALISCRLEQLDYLSGSGARCVTDAYPDAGPMGGIVSCLETMKSDRLLVLAVDLPAMRPEVLEKILAAAERDAGCQEEGSPGCAGISQEVGSGTVVMSGAGVESGALGAVFQSGEFLEPLAAVYPKSMLPAGRRRLEEGNRSLKEWIHESARLMRILPLPEVWSAAFQNVNDPVEWKHWLARGPV